LLTRRKQCRWRFAHRALARLPGNDAFLIYLPFEKFDYAGVLSDLVAVEWRRHRRKAYTRLIGFLVLAPNLENKWDKGHRLGGLAFDAKNRRGVAFGLLRGIALRDRESEGDKV